MTTLPAPAAPVLSDACGPHCVLKEGIERHCTSCHDRLCMASRYDRSQVRRP